MPNEEDGESLQVQDNGRGWGRRREGWLREEWERKDGETLVTVQKNIHKRESVRERKACHIHVHVCTNSTYISCYDNSGNFRVGKFL